MGRPRISYYNRDGAPTSKEDWDAKRKVDLYRIIRQYDNGAVSVAIEWLGKIQDAENSFRDCWPMFVMHCHNYGSDGNLVEDPVNHMKTFPDIETAVAGFEAFLESWTASYRVEDTLVEVDNDLAPPPPPNLDAPSATYGDDAW